MCAACDVQSARVSPHMGVADNKIVRRVIAGGFFLLLLSSLLFLLARRALEGPYLGAIVEKLFLRKVFVYLLAFSPDAVPIYIYYDELGYRY